jgi:ribosomal protein S18 acetylase RimI-like enzyme
MESLHIRRAGEEDAAQIAEVHVRSWQAAYQGQIPEEYLQRLSVEERIQRWQGILGKPQPGCQTLVMEAGEILGFCSIGPCRDEDVGLSSGEIYALYVHPQSMGRGVGSALIISGLASLAKEGFPEVTLWVLASNQQAQRFYEKHGFMSDGKTKTESYKDLPLYEVRYRKPLIG